MRDEGETTSVFKSLALNGRGQIEQEMDLWWRKYLYTNQRFWDGELLSIEPRQPVFEEGRFRRGFNKMGQSSRRWDNVPLK